MPITEGINLSLILSESGVIENASKTILATTSSVKFIESTPTMTKAVKKQINHWREKMLRKSSQSTYGSHFQKEINLYNQVSKWDSNYFIEHLDTVINQLKGTIFYKEAKQLSSQRKSENLTLFHNIFCENWKQYINNSIEEFHSKEVEIDKAELLADIYQRIETIKTMETVTNTGDEKQVGRLWDMASAKLTRTEFGSIKKIAKFLHNHDGLKEIADKLGRMADKPNDVKKERVETNEFRLVEERSDNVISDVVGIHENDDIAKLLPNEVLFLASPELEVIFYKHLVDKQLLNYKMQGTQRKLRKLKAFKQQSEQVEQKKGPFIVCIDASGSMQGLPENYAKAFTYALLKIALEEDRDCYAIMFSTKQISYEFTKQHGLHEVANFLSYSFHGGTDLTSVLEQSIDLMSEKKYNNADVIVLSDFIAPKETDVILDRINLLKQNKNRFHAINLSKYGNPDLLLMFDHCWEYHPSLITQLSKLIRIR